MIQSLLSDLNWLAALAGGVSYFIFGAIWYGVLGKGWMAAAGLTSEQIQKNFKKSNYGITMAMQLVIGIVLAGFMQHICMSEAGLTFGDAAQLGFIIGLVFSGLTTWVHYIYSMQKSNLIWYDLGYTTIATTIAAMVIYLVS
jgi:hypothetical protein